MFGETNGRVDEACIAVLNDHYNVRNIRKILNNTSLSIFLFKDGTKWHDVACENEKPVVCQEEPALLALVDVP